VKQSILFVNNNLHIGGVQKSLVNLIKLIKDDYDITLYLFNKGGDYIDDLPSSVTVIEATYPLKTLGMSLKEVRKTGFKFTLTKIFFVLVSRILGGKIAISIVMRFAEKLDGFDYAISYQHPGPKNMFYGGTNEFVLRNVSAAQKIGFIHCDFKNFGGDIEYSKKLYDSFDKIAFCSRGCEDTFAEAITGATKKSWVVYNSHDIEDILSKSRQMTKLYNPDDFNVVLISRLTFEKGVDVAIRSIYEYLNHYNRKIHLHIVGDGIDRTKFEALTKELELEANITFYGNQRNPYRFMANANLLLLTSLHEAAPMVFDEAQILNIPILATPTTSSHEMILDRNAGWVCQNSATEISNSLSAIASGKMKRETAWKSHSINQGVSQFITMLKAGKGV